MKYHRSLAPFPHEPDDAAASEVSLRPSVPTLARVLMPNRTQIELRAVELESLLPDWWFRRPVPPEMLFEICIPLPDGLTTL